MRDKLTPLSKFLMLAILLLSFGSSRAAVTAWPKIGEKLKNIDEKMISLSEVKGKKGTLVLFSCNHCPYVKAWIQRMVSIGNEALKNGYGVIMINSNDPKSNSTDGFDKMKEFHKVHKMKFPYAMDTTSRVAAQFGAEKTPEVFLFDSKGSLAYHGPVDDNYSDPQKVKNHYLKQAIKEVSQGKVPKIKTAKSTGGCSIKFRKGAKQARAI